MYDSIWQNDFWVKLQNQEPYALYRDVEISKYIKLTKFIRAGDVWERDIKDLITLY